MIGAIERIEAGRRLFLPRRGSVCQEHAPLRPSRSGEIRIGSNGNLDTPSNEPLSGGTLILRYSGQVCFATLSHRPLQIQLSTKPSTLAGNIGVKEEALRTSSLERIPFDRKFSIKSWLPQTTASSAALGLGARQGYVEKSICWPVGSSFVTKAS